MPANRAFLFLPLLAVLIAACASSGRSGSSIRRDPNLISTAEIEEEIQSGVRDLFELVERRRPRWLQVRGERSLNLQTVIAVYHNEARLGGIDALRGYPLTAVTSLKYLDAAQAMLLPGAGSSHVEGAIVISTTTR